MVKKICFATGNIWRWCARSKAFDYIEKIANEKLIDGIEITLGLIWDLDSYSIDKKHLHWIRKLEYRSVHAPFGLARTAESAKELDKQLKKIDKIYKQIRAQNIVIHPHDLPPLEFLEKFPHWNISIENMVPKNKISTKDLEKVFKVSKGKINMQICIDAAHAYLYDEKEFGKLCKKFKGRISQFHLSGTYRNRDHRSMQIVTKRFLDSIKPMHKVDDNVPIIIEEDMEEKSIRKLRAEIKYIRNIFNS